MIALRAEHVSFAYRDRHWVVDDITLEVPAGGCLVVLGPSGSGKTTLVKVLAGLRVPQRGSIEVLGARLGPGAAGPRSQVGYIPQQLGLVRSLSALDNVLVGGLGRASGLGPLFGWFPRRERARALELLDFLGVADKADDQVFRLSGGQRQRVAIARTLFQRPQVVLADEFVSDLDLPRAKQVLTAMRDLGRREGIALVVNLHDIPLVGDLDGEVIILREGRIVHRGRTSAVDETLACAVMA